MTGLCTLCIVSLCNVHRDYYYITNSKFEDNKRVFTKTRNGSSVLFQIFLPEAVLYPTLNPKNFDFSIFNPKSKFFFW